MCVCVCVWVFEGCLCLRSEYTMRVYVCIVFFVYICMCFCIFYSRVWMCISKLQTNKQTSKIHYIKTTTTMKDLSWPHIIWNVRLSTSPAMMHYRLLHYGILSGICLACDTRRHVIRSTLDTIVWISSERVWLRLRLRVNSDIWILFCVVI